MSTQSKEAECRGAAACALSRRMSRAWLLGSWLIAMAALVGCGSDATVVPRTQLTVRLYASSEVLEGMATIRVQTFADGEAVDMRVLRKDELSKWPIDIVIVPAGDNDSSELTEFVAEANDAMGRTLVQQRALASFVPREKHMLEVFLARCGALPLGQLCEPNPACRGDRCLTCATNATCAPTPVTPGAQLAPLNAAEVPIDKDAPWVHVAADAGSDAGADAGLDAGADSGPDSGADGGSEAGLDGGRDAGADAGPDGGEAADGGPPQWDGGTFWCGNPFFWSPATASAPVPTGAPVLATPEITPEGDGDNPGPRNQYVCRVTQSDGSTISGKANGFPSGANAGKLDYGCYFARYYPDTGAWKGEGVDNPGVFFSMFTPPDFCRTSWLPTTGGKVVPDNSLTVAVDARFQKYFACRFQVAEAESTGYHIGRVSKNLGDTCRLQLGGRVLSSANYEILVQDFPPAEDVNADLK
jgi:hypothetical protein